MQLVDEREYKKVSMKPTIVCPPLIGMVGTNFHVPIHSRGTNVEVELRMMVVVVLLVVGSFHLGTFQFVHILNCNRPRK